MYVIPYYLLKSPIFIFTSLLNVSYWHRRMLYWQNTLLIHFSRFVNPFVVFSLNCTINNIYKIQKYTMHFLIRTLNILSTKYLGSRDFNLLIMNQKECIVFTTRYDLQADILYTLFASEIYTLAILKEQYKSIVELFWIASIKIYSVYC